jgi:hypothetical protein
MTKGPVTLPPLSSALAGIPAGVQTTGPWCGRRQLFVKFAGEAETATIYTAAALNGELKRLTSRSRYHSIAVVGPDALIEVDFLIAAFDKPSPLPIMLDHDGQRPSAVKSLLPTLSLVQVTLDGRESGAAIERVCATIASAASEKVQHAVAIAPGPATGDAPLLRIVEQIHGASAETQVIVHPAPEPANEQTRRWVSWLEQAMAAHADVRVIPRWPVAAPAGQDTGTRNARLG